MKRCTELRLAEGQGLPPLRSTSLRGMWVGPGQSRTEPTIPRELVSIQWHCETDCCSRCDVRFAHVWPQVTLSGVGTVRIVELGFMKLVADADTRKILGAAIWAQLAMRSSTASSISCLAVATVRSGQCIHSTVAEMRPSLAAELSTTGDAQRLEVGRSSTPSGSLDTACGVRRDTRQ